MADRWARRSGREGRLKPASCPDSLPHLKEDVEPAGLDVSRPKGCGGPSDDGLSRRPDLFDAIPLESYAGCVSFEDWVGRCEGLDDQPAESEGSKFGVRLPHLGVPVCL